ncbi:MAG: hypothetical protein BGO06_23945 [Shinella sp. 65-6]|nr:HAD-IA family hydrolase [Hyphomicrobiales bacterium]OJU90711.1 MAG: hypothetical protein BGO06_23945 [Shinella sp. 65-6]
MTHPELFIFDCDGVLVDSEILSVRAYVRAYARHGLAIEESDVAKCFGMKQADIFQSIGAATRQVFPPEHAGDLWEEIRTLLQAELVAIAGIDRLLDALPARRCVASSSAPERIALSLSLTGLTQRFGEAVFSSTMVKTGKPAPDLFLHAAACMGAAPAQCVVFEDSIYGIIAARAAGMHAIGFTGGRHLPPGHGALLLEAGAHRVFGSWREAGEAFGLGAEMARVTRR